MSTRELREPEGDRGYTLIEMLIAIVLMGTIVLSIMGGMWAVVRASSMNDQRAKVQAVLGSAADRILGIQYAACPEINGVYEGFADPAAQVVGWTAANVQIIDYKYWNPETSGWDDTNSIQVAGGCNQSTGLTTSKGLQKLTIRATAPGGGYSAQIDIVKSDVAPKEVKDVS